MQTADIIMDVVENKSIFVEFQPIYSINTKKIIGLEALARGKYKDQVLIPNIVFETAKEKGNVLEVDRICREKAMSAFKKESYSPMLFINFETSALNDYNHDNGGILKTASENAIDPECVVIELNASQVSDSYNLMMFVSFYRKHGFRIALHNVGEGEEILERIKFIHPDIIKIDRRIVSGIENNSHNQEVFKSIIGVAKRIGAMTVAEGTETVDEVINCMLMGVDYFQGFYFSKPEQFNYIFSNEVCRKLEEAAQRLNLSIKRNPTAVSIQIETYKRMIYYLISFLTGLDRSEYDYQLYKYVNGNNDIEAAYLMDSKGFQITNTVMREDVPPVPGCKPAVKGFSHDVKNYFYAIKERIEDPFISGWHTSAATGRKCKTISSKFYDKENNLVVVCIDLKK